MQAMPTYRRPPDPRGARPIRKTALAGSIKQYNTPTHTSVSIGDALAWVEYMRACGANRHDRPHLPWWGCRGQLRRPLHPTQKAGNQPNLA